MQKAKNRPIQFVLVFYLICFAFRLIEYFAIRTDQSIIGEAFIHKLIGIGLLALALRALGERWGDIGFRADGALRGIGMGLVLGAAVFAVAYGVEMIAHAAAGRSPSLQFYVTGYTVEGNRPLEGGPVFVLICLLGNVINVVMEEGVFRGLFVTLGERKYSFAKACAFAALLFGLWHVVAPLRNALDGVQSPMGAFMMALMLVATSALAGVQYTLLFKMTGALWASMAFHFFNNASVNLLHVVTATGADEWQTIRLTISGVLSFAAVLILLLRRPRERA